MLIGGPGTGKNHLATAMAVSGIATKGKRVRFCSTVDLVVLEKLGYLPFSQAGGALLFHLLSKSHEHISVIITTNLSFSESSTVFGAAKMTTALLDRPTRHCHIVETGNESYRFQHSSWRPRAGSRRGNRSARPGAATRSLEKQGVTFELAYYERVRFGKASEALVGEQRMLFDETVDMDLAAIDEELRRQSPVKPPCKRAGREPLPPELPRIEHRYEPESCQCGQCGAALVKIGVDVSEQLDMERARFFMHRHIRPQYACRPCETVTAAPIPPAVIDGGMATVGLLAWIAACKYLNHLPLYRIEQIATRQGVPLARSTLADWIGRIGVAPAAAG